MEIAAATTVSVAPQSRRLSNSFSRKLSSVSSLSFCSFDRKYCVGSSRFRVCAASMDAVTAEKISPVSFLDKKETGGVLHFVKYHGLGNDFILEHIQALTIGIGTLFHHLYILENDASSLHSTNLCGSLTVDGSLCINALVIHLLPSYNICLVAKLCDRNFGVGADGVIFAMPGVNGTDYTMRIFNSDGSEPEMCGNGVRCFARFIAELENLQ